MINKLTFNNGIVENFTIILSTRDHRHLGVVNNISNLKCDCKLNGANELSFDVTKEVNDYRERIDSKGNTVADLTYEDPLWDDIFDLRLVYVPELNEYFEIYVSLNESNNNVKNVTGTSCCEAELGQINIYSLEINTENDPNWEDEDEYVKKHSTKFYDPDHSKNSLIDRVLSYVPAYTFEPDNESGGSLFDLVREFSVSDQSVYDFLTGDVAEQFNCLFEFDSVNRKIKVHDLYTVCRNVNCKHRGDFSDVCPKCGSKNLWHFGKDTSVFVSTENLTDQVQLTTDIGSVKNCFKLEAGDENMTAAVVNINPSGSQRIYEFSNESLEDMPKLLVDAMSEYDTMFENYSTKKAYYVKNRAIIVDGEKVTFKNSSGVEQTYYQRNKVKVNYDYLRNKYSSDYKEFSDETLPTLNNCTDDGAEMRIVGFDELTKIEYKLMNLYSYIKTSRMPTSTTDTVTAKGEAEKLKDEMNRTAGQNKFSSIAVSDITSSTSVESINASIVNYAKIFINTGVVKIEVSEGYLKNVDLVNKTATWEGNFLITSFADPEEAYYATPTIVTKEKAMAKSQLHTISIDTSYDLFVNQKIKKNIDKYRDEGIKDILDPDMSIDDFSTNIKKYGFSRMLSIHDACEAVMTILADGKVLSGDEGEDYLIDLYWNMYVPFYIKVLIAECEIRLIAAEMAILYMSEGEYVSFGASYKEYIKKQDSLNNSIIQGFLEDATITTNGILQNIEEIRKKTKEELDYKNFLNGKKHGLYNVFTTYIREQTYVNNNFISDTDKDKTQVLIDRAKEFTSRAKEELHKSSKYQHSISTNMNNILAIEEFSPIVDSFELGNFIRVGIDDKVYRLRLISYSIDFNSPESLSTEFSDVTETASGINDINSILSQASSMASSYSYVSSQSENADDVSKGVSDLLGAGLNSANTTISNNVNEEVIINECGITLKTMDFDSNQYSPEQARLTHNIFCYTANNWQTIKCALGKHDFYRFKDNKLITDNGYGLTADFMSAGYIFGSQMISGNMYSYNYNPGKEGTHIDLTDGSFEVCNNGTTKIKYGYQSDKTKPAKLQLNNVDILCQKDGTHFAQINSDGTFQFKSGNSRLYYDADNSTLLFEGKIKSSTGDIAGWQIVPNALWKSSEGIDYYGYDSDAKRINKEDYWVLMQNPSRDNTRNTVFAVCSSYQYYHNDDGSWKNVNDHSKGDYSTASFRVNKNGKLFATDAVIKGTIEAETLILSESAEKKIIGLTDGKYATQTELSEYAKSKLLDDYYRHDEKIPTTTVKKSDKDKDSGIYTVSVYDQYGIEQTSYAVADKDDYLIVDRAKGTPTSDHSDTCFKISKSGALVADNALIYGTIYAGAGSIGSWSISANENKTTTALQSNDYRTTGRWVTLNPHPITSGTSTDIIWDTFTFCYGKNWQIEQAHQNNSDYYWWYPFAVHEDGRTRIDSAERIYCFNIGKSEEYNSKTVNASFIQTGEFQVGTANISTLSRRKKVGTQDFDAKYYGKFQYVFDDDGWENGVYLSASEGEDLHIGVYGKKQDGTSGSIVTKYWDRFYFSDLKTPQRSDTFSENKENCTYFQYGHLYFTRYKSETEDPHEKHIHIDDYGCLCINGSHITTSSGNISDRRLKNSFSEIDKNESAEFIYSLKPTRFKYNSDEDKEVYHHGFIAQEVEEIKKDDKWQIVCENEVTIDDQSYKTLHYQEIIADLVATVQTLNERIIALENK